MAAMAAIGTERIPSAIALSRVMIVSSHSELSHLATGVADRDTDCRMSVWVACATDYVQCMAALRSQQPEDCSLA
jgi:stage III sporulation protein SpoIIIAA